MEGEIMRHVRKLTFPFVITPCVFFFFFQGPSSTLPPKSSTQLGWWPPNHPSSTHHDEACLSCIYGCGWFEICITSVDILGINPAWPQLVITFKLVKHLLCGILDLGFSDSGCLILGFWGFMTFFVTCDSFRGLRFATSSSPAACRGFLGFGGHKGKGVTCDGFWGLGGQGKRCHM